MQIASPDVTIIGGGPGGYVAAIRAAQLGAKVVLVEKGHVGGVCLNRGCIPTKTLLACAETYATVREAAAFGVTIDGNIGFDWTRMLAIKDRTVAELRKGVQGLLKSNGVEVLAGTARFLDRTRVGVRGADGIETVLKNRNVIIATGSTTVMPGFVPQAANVLISTSALERDPLPADILILGGGVIGCEFACLYARLGVTVTLVEMLPEILPMVDLDVARTVKAGMKRLGVTVMTGTRVTDIAADGRQVTASIEGGNSVTAAALLVCVGRKPVTDGLDLAAAGVVVDERGLIPVNAQCRTRAAGIYAIGDVAGAIQYAHRASAMGICAANNSMGRADTHSDALVPGCIFTAPEIGAVGLTEAQAKAENRSVRVGKFPFAALGKARAIQATDGFCKVIADAETDQVLGVHIVGPHATDLIAEAATAMNLEITAAELGRAMHAHPTLPEALMEAAHAVHDHCIHMPRLKPRKG